MEAMMLLWKTNMDLGPKDGGLGLTQQLTLPGIKTLVTGLWHCFQNFFLDTFFGRNSPFYKLNSS